MGNVKLDGVPIKIKNYMTFLHSISSFPSTSYKLDTIALSCLLFLLMILVQNFMLIKNHTETWVWKSTEMKLLYLTSMLKIFQMPILFLLTICPMQICFSYAIVFSLKKYMSALQSCTQIYKIMLCLCDKVS